MFRWVSRGAKKIGKKIANGADMSLLSKFYYFVKNIFVTIFIRETGTHETFEEAMERLQLSEEALAARKKVFKMQMLLYGIGAIAVGAYTLYLLIHNHWYSVSLSFLLTIFLIVSSLRSHFWVFQIQQRKLGCTLQEWLNASIKESE